MSRLLLHVLVLGAALAEHKGHGPGTQEKSAEKHPQKSLHSRKVPSRPLHPLSPYLPLVVPSSSTAVPLTALPPLRLPQRTPYRSIRLYPCPLPSFLISPPPPPPPPPPRRRHCVCLPFHSTPYPNHNPPLPLPLPLTLTLYPDPDPDHSSQLSRRLPGPSPPLYA